MDATCYHWIVQDTRERLEMGDLLSTMSIENLTIRT